MAAKKSSTAKNNQTEEQALDFEASLEKLEQLVERMENGELALEDSLKAFEEGVKLTRQCQQTLNAAQQKVQRLMEQNGDFRLEDASDLMDDDS